MRTVAVLIALVSALALVPPASADDCENDVSRQQACQEIDARKPAMPPNVPALPNTPYWDTYYLYVGAGVCTSDPLGRACPGTPAAPGSGVPTPDGGSAVGLGVFGILWQETNGLGGLQRAVTSGRVPDKMVLV